MGLETAPFINSLVSSNPASGDPKNQGDDHLRLIKATLQSTFPNATRAFRFPAVLSKNANYTVLASDDNTTIFVDASAAARTITLPNVATIYSGFTVRICKAEGSANNVNVVPTESETILGASSRILNREYQQEEYVWGGTAWYITSWGLKTLSQYLGTAAFLDVGTTANKIVQLDASARLPAVSGALLTNLPIPADFIQKVLIAAVTATDGTSCSQAWTANTWTKISLSGTDINEISGASISGGSLVLPVGKFLVEGWMAFGGNGGCRARLWLPASSLVLAISNSGRNTFSGSGQVPVFFSSKLNIGAPATIDLQFICENSGNSPIVCPHDQVTGGVERYAVIRVMMVET